MTYVRSLALEDPDRLPTMIESKDMEDLESLLPKYEQKDQAVAIGSQITEFSKAIPADIRPAISNSLLLAQLAVTSG